VRECGATIYFTSGCPVKGRDKDDLARVRAGIWTSWRYFRLVLIVLVILGFAVWYMAHVTVR
jgi:hypothetical protein